MTFDERDFVWVILTKDHYPTDEYNKLSERKISPCKALKRINDDAYQVKLLSHLKTPDVFNVKHLVPYIGDSSKNEAFNRRRVLSSPGRMMRLVWRLSSWRNATPLSRVENPIEFWPSVLNSRPFVIAQLFQPAFDV